MDPSAHLIGPVPDPLPVAIGPGGRVVPPWERRPARRDAADGTGIRQVVTELGFAPAASREDSWRRLPLRVADRLIELAGTRIEWWATARGENRPLAVVIGSTGVCFADPRVNSAQEPVYAVSCYQLDPASFRHAAVAFRPGPPGPPPGAGPALAVRPGAELSGAAAPGVAAPGVAAPGVAAPGAAPAAAAAGAVPPAPALPGLDTRTSEMLGNLPPEAQRLLRAPFSHSAPVLRSAFHYHGEAHQLDLFVMVLAGAAHVTLAVGSRVIPVGHDEGSAHWSLTCGRATVVRRIGR